MPATEMLCGPRVDRAEILLEIVDELAVGGEIKDLLVEDEVVADFRAEQEA
jgi:hypothetical protein